MNNPAYIKSRIKINKIYIICVFFFLTIVFIFSSTFQSIFNIKIKPSLTNKTNFLLISTNKNIKYHEGDIIYHEINDKIYTIDTIKSITNSLFINEEGITYSLENIDGKVIYSFAYYYLFFIFIILFIIISYEKNILYKK